MAKNNRLPRDHYANYNSAKEIKNVFNELKTWDWKSITSGASDVLDVVGDFVPGAGAIGKVVGGISEKLGNETTQPKGEPPALNNKKGNTIYIIK